MKNLALYIIISCYSLLFGKLSAQFADTNVHIIRSWKYDLVTGIKNNTDFDTNVFVVARYNPLLEKSYSNIYLGNIGSAGISNIYNERINSPFIFGKGYTPYLFNDQTYFVYKTKKPFTLVTFTIGDKKSQEERTLDVLQTQNINQFTNVGFRIRNIQSTGQLKNQKILLNNLSIFGSYEKNKVKFMASVNRNMFKNQENGGVNDSSFINTKDLGRIITNFDDAFDANSIFRNYNIHVLSEYKLINFKKSTDTLNTETRTSIIFGQLTNYDQYYRKFTANGIDPVFDTSYISNQNTNDSAFLRTFTNRIYFKFKSGNQFITGGIENQFLKYAHKIIPDTTYLIQENNNGSIILFEEHQIKTSKKENQFNTSLFGDIEINISDLLNLKFIGRYYLFGYQQNMIDLSGRALLNFKKAVIKINSELNTRKPDYFYNNYISNFYIWNNNFKNIQDWNTEILIRYKKKSTGIRLNYNLISNLLYFNNDAVPDQLDKITSVLSAKFFGEFDFWKFKTRNDIAFQRSGDEFALPLPAMTIFHSLSFNQKLFDDALHFNIGYDLYFYSKYYAYAYMPATGVFYSQNEKKTGSYPFVDAFLNFKVKKTLFFFKYEHVNQLNDHADDEGNKILYGKEYFTTLHYPSPGRVLRFGLRWIFLN